jgi:hypothetical protein
MLPPVKLQETNPVLVLQDKRDLYLTPTNHNLTPTNLAVVVHLTQTNHNLTQTKKHHPNLNLNLNLNLSQNLSLNLNQDQDHLSLPNLNHR